MDFLFNSQERHSSFTFKDISATPFYTVLYGIPFTYTEKRISMRVFPI